MNECFNSISELTNKEVINVSDGKRLGYAIDFEIDIFCGKITAIVLPGNCSAFGFKKNADIIIPWSKICRIGEDTILVEIGCTPLPEPDFQENRRKKHKFFK